MSAAADINRVREVWAGGGVAVNAWLWFADAFAAEVIAAQGFDSVTVDLQHGMIDMGSAIALLQVLSSQPVASLARVPANEPAAVMKLLDAGALGIICPMVSTRAECERFVAACRYPPTGVRSFGPARAALRWGADYHERADAAVLTFAMIETREALGNLEDILSVDGLDAVYVGPNDLSLALGYEATQDSVQAEVVEAIATIRDAALRHGVVPGIACPSGAVARRRVAEGFRFVTPGNQANMLAAAAKAALADARDGRSEGNANP